MAMQNGFGPDKAMALSLFVAKVHGLAVAEHARGQGIAGALLKRAWQVYQQLGYYLVYGSYEADRDRGAFYTRHGWTVHAPGEPSPSTHRPTVPTPGATTSACSPAGAPRR
ncbi:GNAT family N-acetyltransferase [Streptomyces sp. NPDC046866]|uniref:GNAT family N-acetyltransferase n=1 Tax=Streptomyces sp. NPDC046866 TaxID=3154921 RepID=UPI0034546955